MANRLYYGNSKMVSCRLSYVQTLIKLDLKNVRYLQESGVYQCVAENPHGMIVSYTVVKVRRKHLENCIYTIEPSFPFYKRGLSFSLF